MTTYAVLAPHNRVKPVRGRNLSQAAALNLARAESGDFWGIFVVVDEATLAEVAAYNDSRRYHGYRTAAKAKHCNPAPTYAGLLGAA